MSANGSATGDGGSRKDRDLEAARTHSPYHQQAMISSVLPTLLLARHSWAVMLSAGCTEAVGEAGHSPGVRPLQPLPGTLLRHPGWGATRTVLGTAQVCNAISAA